jgi:ATP-dependent DNA helicase RecQ
LLQQDITAHSVLKLQPAARAVLRGEHALSLAVPRLQSVKREPERLSKQHYDRVLFARLKTLRKHIAQRDDVPPFVVFSDASLIEMCQHLPTDNRSLLAISGVGQTKLARYGVDFIDEISDYLAEDNQPPPGKLA